MVSEVGGDGPLFGTTNLVVHRRASIRGVARTVARATLAADIH
ncbi:MAG: hypothetical protein ABW133_24415 [Polyangiaceae bacterium]